MPYFAVRNFSIDNHPFCPGDRVDDCDRIPMLAGHLLDSGRVELRASPPPPLPPAPLAATAISERKTPHKRTSIRPTCARRPFALPRLKFYPAAQHQATPRDRVSSLAPHDPKRQFASAFVRERIFALFSAKKSALLLGKKLLDWDASENLFGRALAHFWPI
jgi:hypothetical protein